MKKIITTLLITLVIASCNDQPKTVIVKISPALVYNTGTFGYVSTGSVLFYFSGAEKGFRIEVYRGKDVEQTWFCPDSSVCHCIEMVKYNYQPDSVIGIDYHKIKNDSSITQCF